MDIALAKINLFFFHPFLHKSHFYSFECQLMTEGRWHICNCICKLNRILFGVLIWVSLVSFKQVSKALWTRELMHSTLALGLCSNLQSVVCCRQGENSFGLHFRAGCWEGVVNHKLRVAFKVTGTL